MIEATLLCKGCMSHKPPAAFSENNKARCLNCLARIKRNTARSEGLRLAQGRTTAKKYSKDDRRWLKYVETLR